jgi:arabinan endo-1,5-alpha-L-arabinosidase
MGLSAAALTAGCSGDADDGGGPTETGTPTPTPTATPTPTPEPLAYENPVFEPILADPTAIRTDDGTYYAYGTQDDWGDGEGSRIAPIVRSENLVDWEYVGEAFEEKPDWKDGNVWAPAVTVVDGEWILYYSLSVWGDEDPGIGVATADSPEGPFTDHGELIRSSDIGVPNSIDPFYIEDGGTPYLFWGSFNGIYGIELGADRRSLAGEKFLIAGERYEGTYIEEVDGTYYFFGSSGSCCEGAFSTYRVEVGRSASLEGPYVNANGEDLRERPGEVVVDDGEAFHAPGHNSMVTDDAGQRWLLYHAYDTDQFWIRNTPRRPLCLDPITWDDGWPTVPGQSPSTSRESGPVVDTE